VTHDRILTPARVWTLDPAPAHAAPHRPRRRSPRPAPLDHASSPALTPLTAILAALAALVGAYMALAVLRVVLPRLRNHQ